MVGCPSEEELAAFVAGYSADPEAERVRGHLRDCVKCSDWVTEAGVDEDVLRNLREALESAEPSLHAGGYRPQGGEHSPDSWPTKDPLLGQLIGHYRVIRVLGRGGMGVVYEAEQQHPRRIVALKLIRAGVASPQQLRRFEHEAQILGRLEHPGIATIFEAGTLRAPDEERPFFALELIKGEPLTAYARQRHLTTHQRLELIAKIGDALQHAHQKGIIHRDLKPSNILVTETGQPKILDFGVARATDGDIQMATLQTDIGKLVGTVPYMSPEQVAGDPMDVDTRSDIYALGVVTYELLAGRLPYDLRNRLVHEAARMIREDGPTPLSSIRKDFRGDVEIIVAKALEKDRSRRYATANDLASDLRRYLNNQPIVARRASTAYQVTKFVRRNKTLAGSLLIILIVLVSGVLGIVLALGRANEARRAAESSRAQTRFVFQRFAESVHYMLNHVSQGFPIAFGLHLEAERLLGKDDPLVLQTAWLAAKEMEQEGDYEGAEELLLPILKSASTDGLSKTRTLQLSVDLATVLIDQKKDAEALKMLDSQRSFVDGLSDFEVGTLSRKSTFYWRLGEAQLRTGDVRAAEASLRRSYEYDERAGVACLLVELSVDKEADETEEAWLSKCIDHGCLESGAPQLQLADRLAAQQLDARAEWLYRSVLEMCRCAGGTSHPTALDALHRLAWFLLSRRRFEEALPLYRDAVDLFQQNYGDKNLRTAILKAEMGRTLTSLERFDESLAIFKSIAPSSLYADPKWLGEYEWYYGELSLKLKDWQAAEERLTNAYGRLLQAGASEEWLSGIADRLVELYEALDRTDEATDWRARTQRLRGSEEQSPKAPK